MNYIMHSVKCAVLSFVLASGAGAMKYGSAFQLQVKALLSGMSFEEVTINFPSGNQMKEQDLYAQLHNFSRKAYDAALKTNMADMGYNFELFDQAIIPWLEYFSNFVFNQDNSLQQDGVIVNRAKNFEYKGRFLQESCVMVTEDPMIPNNAKAIIVKCAVLVDK